MTNDSLVDRLHQELQAAQLRCNGMRRVGDVIYILYGDHRIDSDKLNPIFDRHHSRFSISYNTPIFSEEDLRTCGFTPEEIGKKNWNYVLELDGEIITIKPK